MKNFLYLDFRCQFFIFDKENKFQAICDSRGWGTDNAKLEQTKGTLLKIWEGLKQRADSDQDGQVI